MYFNCIETIQVKKKDLKPRKPFYKKVSWTFQKFFNGIFLLDNRFYFPVLSEKKILYNEKKNF